MRNSLSRSDYEDFVWNVVMQKWRQMNKLSMHNEVKFVEDHGWEEWIRLYRNRKGGSGHRVGGSPEDGGDTGMAGEKKKSSTRKYVCSLCGMSVRAMKIVRIACIDCGNVQMIPAK